MRRPFQSAISCTGANLPISYSLFADNLIIRFGVTVNQPSPDFGVSVLSCFLPGEFTTTPGCFFACCAKQKVQEKSDRIKCVNAPLDSSYFFKHYPYRRRCHDPKWRQRDYCHQLKAADVGGSSDRDGLSDSRTPIWPIVWGKQRILYNAPHTCQT